MAWRAERLLAHLPTYRSSKRKRVEDALSLRQIGVPVRRAVAAQHFHHLLEPPLTPDGIEDAVTSMNIEPFLKTNGPGVHYLRLASETFPLLQTFTAHGLTVVLDPRTAPVTPTVGRAR